jgi:hypothetical protein
MPEEKFPLPKCSYDSLIKIIRSYAHQSAEAHLDEIAKVAGMAPGEVSRNVRFLVTVGLLEGGQKKVISEQGRALSHALEYEQFDKVAELWRDIVLRNDFLQKLVFAVKIRKGMDPATLQAHVAYSAGQPKHGKTMIGAGAVVEIIKQAGLVTDEEGKLVAVPFEETKPLEVPSKAEEYQHRVQGGVTVGGAAGQLFVPAALGVHGIPVTIQIQVNCSSSEIEALGPKLRALVEELSGIKRSPESQEDE